VIAEGCYTATDPPLRLLRRYIPSIRLGSVALDLSFMLLFLVVLVLLQAVGQL
jgi:YggT family protein